MTDSCKEIFGSSHHSVFTWNRPADRALSSSIATILLGKSELVALFILSSWCLVMGEWPLLAVPWCCLRFVIVVFPNHTHLLFLCLSCFRVCSLLPYGHLKGKGWPLGSCLWCFFVILLLSHLVSWDRCGTWLYRFLILVVFLILSVVAIARSVTPSTHLGVQ